MLKWFPILFIAWLSHGCAYAQVDKTDSLKKILPSLRDTLRVKALNELAFLTMFSEPAEAEQYASDAIALGSDINYISGVVNAHFMKGALSDIKGNYEQSIEIYNDGLKIMEDKGGTPSLYLALYNGLGLVYSRKGEYPKALDYYFKSLNISESTQDKYGLTNILLNIGLVYYDQGDYDKALEYYFKCRDRAVAFGERLTLAKVLTNIGIVYKEMKRYDEAIKFYLEALEVKKPFNDVLSLSISYNNLAEIYAELKNYSLALSYLDQAEAAKRKVNDRWGLVLVDDTRAKIFIAQAQFDKAEKLLRDNLRIVDELGGKSKTQIYGRLYELYHAKKDHKTALEWHLKKTAYNDSIYNVTKSKQLAELQTLYEVNKKEKEIVQLEKDNQQEKFAKNVSVISLIALAVTALFTSYFIRFKVKRRQQLQDIELKLQQNKVENAKLREAELRQEIEYKNKELASYTMNFVQKSELMEELKKSLQEINPAEKDVAKKISGISKLIENTYQVDREWEDFKLQFENVHSNFFKLLKERCPDLTNGDLKLCALLKLNMNMKEAAKILGISPESVKTARYRLRKKFNLLQEDNLVDFIQNIHPEEAPKVFTRVA